MGQMAVAVSVPTIRPQNLRALERHFIAPDIYQRDDFAERQKKLASIVSSEIVPRLLMLHAEVVPDAPPVAVVEALLPAGRILVAWLKLCWEATSRQPPPM